MPVRQIAYLPQNTRLVLTRQTWSIKLCKSQEVFLRIKAFWKLPFLSGNPTVLKNITSTSKS